MTRQVVIRTDDGEHQVPIDIARHQVQVGAAVIVTEHPNRPAITVEQMSSTRRAPRRREELTDVSHADTAGA